MKSVRLRSIQRRPDPADPECQNTPYPRLLAEYFVSLLARLGPGRLEGERYWNESNLEVEWIYEPALESESMIACVRHEPVRVEAVSGDHFRQMLDRLGLMLLDELDGSGIFELYFLDAPDALVGRFQVYICNLREKGFWVRLYFYSRT